MRPLGGQRPQLGRVVYFTHIHIVRWAGWPPGELWQSHKASFLAGPRACQLVFSLKEVLPQFEIVDRFDSFLDSYYALRYTLYTIKVKMIYNLERKE